MSKNVRSLILKSVLVVLALGLNFFAACEIGLGSSVDVESPKIDFAETTVGSGAVVRDAFAVFGTFDDDGSIGSLTAKLTNLTTGTVIEKSGKVNDSDKTWNLSFSPADEGIIDGTYDLNITIKDTADHETKISRTIIVDNTAPLVVLTRPSTRAGADSFDSYGQKFTLEGKAADDNDVSLIEVNVYADASCSGTPLKTITLPNVPLTIESDVATYDKDAANDYSVIYGHVDTSGIAIRDGTSVQRYCKLVVYDGAQRYPADGSAQSEEDKKGNSVEYYYLNKELSDLFTAGYKITELYHILNGSYTAGGARSISTSGVVSMLQDPSKHVTSGQFRINPENSPHFVVSARNVLPEGGNLADYPITNGNTNLEIEITPGLDGHIIKEETVGVYLVRCDAAGNPLKADGTPGTVNRNNPDDAQTTTAKIIWLIEKDKHAQQATVTESGSTYKFKTKEKIGNEKFPLVIGENYYIDVVGKDNQGNAILSEGKYGFQLITSGKNIEVGIKSEPDWLSTAPGANAANTKVKVTLTYQNDNKPFDIYRAFDADIEASTAVYDEKTETDKNLSPYVDEITDLSSEPTKIAYKIKGKDSAESNQKEVSLQYDNTHPTVTITSVPNTTATQQTSITFEGTASDTQSGVKTVYVQIIDNDDSTAATPAALATGAIKASYSGGEWLSQIRPGDYANAEDSTQNITEGAFHKEGKKKIKVTAVDGVGLKEVANDEFMYDKAAPSVSVTSSVPTITGKTFTLSGTASDSYKIANLKIEQIKDGGTPVDITPSVWSNAAEQTSYNWSVTVPVKAANESNISNGNYSYKITVTDYSGADTTNAGAKTNDVTVSTKYYSAKPTITFSQPSGSYTLTADASTTPWQTTSNDITISGSAIVSQTAGNGVSIAGVYYKYDPSTVPASWSSSDSTWENIGQASWSVTRTISDSATAHNLYFVAVDNAGNVSDIVHRVVKVDKSAPVLTVNYKKGSATLTSPYVKPGDTITLEGNYSDPHSGVDPLEVKLGTTDYSSSVTTSNGTWSATIHPTINDGGRFTVKGKNKANLGETETSTFELTVDGERPNFVNLKLKDSSDTEAYMNGSTYHINNTSGTFKVTGTATDNYGVEKVKFSVINTADTTKTITIADIDNPSGSWEREISGWSVWTDGATVTVTAVDKAGNEKTETLNITFDTIQPTASIDTTNWKDNLWISGTGKVYINGAASDASSIKSITMKLGSGTPSIVPVANPWTYELDCTNLTENDTTANSKHSLTLTVTDGCGNVKTVTKDFKLDKSTPVIKNLSVRNATTGAFTKDIKDVTASGLAYDGAQNKYRPVTVTITATDSNEAAADIGGTNKVITVTTTSTQNTTFGSFSQAVATKTLADGEYDFTIKATDYAGNEAQEKVTITVDNTPPVVNTASLGSWNTTGSAATITATFTDANPDAAYYYINDGSDPSLTQTSVPDADWVSMNVNGSTATKSCTFSDGKGKVYVKVVDKAGNVGYGTPIDYEVDTKAPDVCTLLTVDGAALTGSKLINGNNDVVFTVNATDYNDNRNSSGAVIGNDATRVTSVKLTKIGNDEYTGTAIVNGTATLSGGVQTGEWTITIPKSKFNGKTSGSFPVTVTVTDTTINGKSRSKEYQLFTLDIDQEKPTLNSYALTSSYDAGVVSGVQTFYMNNVRDIFTLTGIAKDNREIDEVKLTIKNSSGTVLKELTSSDSAWTFTSANTAAQGQASNAWTSAWNDWTGFVTAELTVKDKAQNMAAATTSFKIIFDTTAPAALHKNDASGKDIYFRVGDQQNDDITSSNSLWNDDIDKDVGGKYKAGTFGNKETIKIRGNFDEAGSGIAMIYYKLYETVPTGNQIAEFQSTPAAKADGYFSQKSASETTRRVFYTGTVSGITADGTAGGKNYKSIASTFLTTISGFKAGHNYLVLVAVDNVGNAAVDNISGGYYSINVDTQAPETATIADKYIGKNEDLKLALTVTDYPTGTNAVSAGIKSVKVKMNGVANEQTATLDETTTSPTYGKYVVTIPASELPGTGTYSVSVTALDNAGTGNPDTRVVGSVIVDKTDPQIRVTSTSGWIRNSIDGASVYVSDANGLKTNAGNNEFVTYNVYSASDTSYANPLLTTDGTIEVSSNEATVPAIATTDTTKFVDGISYIVRFTAEDIVGNKAYINTGNYTIDRTIPVLNDTVSGIDGVNGETAVEASNKYFKSETLPVTGSFTDKAGSVEGSGVTAINYSLTPAGSTTITGSWSSADGSYSTNLAGFENGTNTLTLSAVDAMGNTSASTTYTVKVDNIAPTISEVPDATTPTIADPEFAFTKIKLTNGTGTRVFKFNVTDTGSGFDTTVSNITVKAGSRSITNGANGSSIAVAGNTVTVTIGATDLAALNGNNSVTVTVKDNAGNRSNSERIGVLNVDKDRPVPEFTSHQASATVNKTITLSGKVTDTSNSAIEAISLTATCGSISKNYAFPAGATGSDGDITYANGLWSITIDTTEFNDTITAADFDLSITATDEAGNTSTVVPLALSIDQNTDRPVVKFTNLVQEGSSYILKYGNEAALEGSITDDDSTSTSVVKEFKASGKAFEFNADGSLKTSAIEGTTTFDTSTGDFKFTPANHDDGTKKVYFYIKDNNDNVFYTKNAVSQLERPYQQYKTDSPADNNDMLSYMSDSNAPDVNYKKVQAYTADLTDPANPVYTTNGSNVDLGESCVVGGETKNYIDISVSAKDGNGIQKIEVTVNGTPETGTLTAADAQGNRIFTTGKIDISSLGAADVKTDITVVVKVTDNSGLYNRQESKFVIDREKPSINITTPSTDGALYYGTIEQNVAGSVIGGGDIANVYFKVSETSGLTDFDDGIDVGDVNASVSVVFDGNLSSSSNGKHTHTLHTWIQNLRQNDKAFKQQYLWKDVKAETDALTTYYTDANLTVHPTTATTDNTTVYSYYQIEKTDDNVELYIYYKAVDNCGNFTVRGRKLNVIPNGDKPYVEIAYPKNKPDANNELTVTPSLAGTIRLNGTSRIQAYDVDSVYIQIAANYSSTYNWANWETSAITNNYTVVEIPFSGGLRGIKAEGTVDNWNLPINGNKEFGDTTIPMAIRVYALHKRTDMNGNEIGKISDPVIQQFIIDPNAPHIGGDDKVEDGEMRYSLQLVQFDSTANVGDPDHITKRAAYKSEMWVTGAWYLFASVYDNQGINKITLSTPAAQELIGTTNVIETDSGTAAKNYNICIPLPTGAGSGSLAWTIEATEKSENNFSSKETIRINYDNTPPKISTKDYVLDSEKMFMDTTVNDKDGFHKLKGYVSDAGGNASGLFGVAFYFVRRGTKNCIYDPMYHRQNSVSLTASNLVYANGLYWKHKELATRSNDLSKISLKATDTDLANIHTGGLVMLEGKIYKIKAWNETSKEITLNENAPKTITTADFALAMLVDNRNGESQVIGSQDLDSTHKNNYAYGYCTNMTDDDGDHMYERLSGDTEGRWEASIYSKNIPDGPIEIHYVAFDKAQNYTIGVVGSLSKTAYEALTTDDAKEAKKLSTSAETNDNLTTYYQYHQDAKTMVSNNAPRLASVSIGIDYNGNGSIDDSEKKTEYYGGSISVGTAKKAKEITDKDPWILSTTGDKNGAAKSDYIVKDYTEVGFEIIGGNGNIYYQYSIDSAYEDHGNIASTAWVRNTKADGSYNPMTVTRIKNEQNEEIEGKALDEEGRTYYNASTVSAIPFTVDTIKNKVSKPANTDNPTTAWWTIELHDSTEDSTLFTDSQFAELKLPLKVAVWDETPPNTVISPLYWKSATENSVYRDSDSKTYGHVELKSDLGTSVLGTTYDTTDDKVSGTVIFRGYAYDNKRLSEIEWAIVSSAGKSILPNNTNGISYTTGATYVNGNWTGSGSLGDAIPVNATKHYKFTVNELFDADTTWNYDGTKAYLDEKGHKVYWELIVDTSAINGTVAKDAKLYVRAKDASGSSTTQYTVMTGTGSTGSAAAGVTDQETIDRATKAPTYQVDIVPYITGVETALKKSLKTSIVDAYTRTTLGHYIVREGEEVTFTGYNLAGAKYVKTKGTGNTADTTVNMTNGKLTVSNANISTSSEILLKVGDLYTINNMNNNNAKGSYTGTISDSSTYNNLSNYAYNRKPNNRGNNLLTDDVYFDIWQFDADAATPVSGELREPAMKINPVTGKIGVAFVSGPADFSMPMGKNTDAADVSWQVFQHNYATFSNVALCYDSRGNSYGITTGLDTMPDGNKTTLAGRFTFQTSKWGTGNIDEKQDNYNGDNKLRLEAIGLPGDNQCYVKGEYPSKYTMTETRFYSPSIVATTHGNDTSVYLAYFDSVQGQIRFRYGKTVAGTKGDFDNFIDNTGINDSLEPGSWWSDARKYVFEANTSAFSLIAGTDWQKSRNAANTNDGYTNKVGSNYFYYTGFGAKKYVEIDAIQGSESSKDVIVAVWYDGKDCRYAYTTNPTSGKDNGKEGGWTGNKVIFSDGGEHCAIKVGPDGSIHIAANVDGALKYAYLSSYSASYNEATDAVTVDSYAITGEKITIDVGRKAFTSGGTTTYKVVPYISYYLNSAKKPAVASLVIPSSGTMNYKAQGTDSSSNFTGNWDVSLVPVAETLTDLAVDKINVALWKKTVGTGNNAVTGVITGCTDNAFLSKSKTMANNAAGQCYGNGTSNPVIGYAIVTNSGTAFSLAQKK